LCHAPLEFAAAYLSGPTDRPHPKIVISTGAQRSGETPVFALLRSTNTPKPEHPMTDTLCILLILIFFAIAHAYTCACDRLKAKPRHD